LGCLWGGFRVAKGWLVGGYVHHAYTIRTISVHQPYTMSTGSWVAFGWLQISLSPRFQPFLPSSFYILPSPRGGFGRFGGRCPPFLHSSFFILPSPQSGFGRFGVVAISAFPSAVARLRRMDCFPGFCLSSPLPSRAFHPAAALPQNAPADHVSGRSSNGLATRCPPCRSTCV
jgi:hypothetical protein